MTRNLEDKFVSLRRAFCNNRIDVTQINSVASYWHDSKQRFNLSSVQI